MLRLCSNHCGLLLKVQLQGIFQSKHVHHFLLQVLELQKQLTIADSVLLTWMEVQRTWAYLESIFKGCDDLRQQLPGDAKRFQAIDSEFQVCGQKSQNLPERTHLSAIISVKINPLFAIARSHNNDEKTTSRLSHIVAHMKFFK